MQPDPVLKKVRLAVEAGEPGPFCYLCGRPGVQPEQTVEGEGFVCPEGHHSPRSYLFDGKACYSFSDGVLVHESVGALVQQQAGPERQTLLFLRRKFPYLYTLPAGHLEIGRIAAEEAVRELWEETGLEARSASALWADDPPLFYDPCRRGSDWHRWQLFQIEADGLPRLSDEGRVIGWYLDVEIKAFAAQKMLASSTHQVFSRLGLVPPGNYPLHP